MTSPRWIDLAAALFFAVGGIVVWLSADAIPPSFLDSGFGADLLPKALAAVLVALSLPLAVSAFAGGAAFATGFAMTL